MDAENNLTEVVETKNIVKTADGAEADGKVIDVNSLVSMNMWGLTPDFLDVLEEGFKEFFEKEVLGNPLKAEYLIPIFIGELLEQGKMSVKVQMCIRDSPNIAAQVIMIIILLWLVEKGRNIKKRDYAIFELIVIFVFVVTKSRTATLIVAMAPIIIEITKRICVKKSHRKISVDVYKRQVYSRTV